MSHRDRQHDDDDIYIYIYIYIYIRIYILYIYIYIYIFRQISLTNVHYFDNDVTVCTDSILNGNYITFIVMFFLILLYYYCFNMTFYISLMNKYCASQCHERHRVADSRTL